MNTEIYYTIKTGAAEVEFKTEYDENGDVADGYAFHPLTNQPTTNILSGWSMEDTRTQDEYAAINDLYHSPELFEIIADAEPCDIDKEIKYIYYCDGYVTTNKEYEFKIIITDIIKYE